MKLSGAGAERWRVRVGFLVAEGSVSKWIDRAAHGLDAVLEDDGERRRGDGYYTDQGRGIEGRPVVGLLFWVKADDVGAAATEATRAARRALGDGGEELQLYDVTVIPEASVSWPDDPPYPGMPH